MLPLSPELKRSFELSSDWQTSLGVTLKAHKSKFSVILNIAEQLRRASRGDLSLELLKPWKRILATDGQLWFALALAYWDAQLMKEAKKAIIRACRISPSEPNYQFARAQILYEMRDATASEAFQTAHELDPDNLTIVKNLASCRASDGDVCSALHILEKALHVHPDWIDGLNTLSVLKSIYNKKGVYKAYSKATDNKSGNLQVLLAWFYQAAKSRDWAVAQNVLETTINLSPSHHAVRAAKAYLLSETQAEIEYSALFSDTRELSDPGLDLCRVRYALKTGAYDRAKALCEARITSPQAQMFYPYLSLCWQLLGDERFDWLEREGALIKTYSLEFDADRMEAFRTCISSLHKMHASYPEQSVKSGTQTDRNLFLADIDEIQDIKNEVLRCAGDYVSSLPKHDPNHPFLKSQRDVLKFSGSWSVRFLGEGFHSLHTHPVGWISSACYFSFPSESECGPEPAGFLKFGGGPPELGLPIKPYKWVKPEVGKLVLFPSYTWHGTEPIQGGERLTIAFDIL